MPHTPGPWEALVCHTSISIRNISGSVALVPTRGTHREAGPANARLIAAVPDLLEAAIEQEKLSSLEFEGDPQEAIARVRTMRRAAIAKAQGQQP